MPAATSPAISYIQRYRYPMPAGENVALQADVASGQICNVSPLFRQSEEKAARKAAAKQEIQRLRALSVDDLAVDVLPGLGPDGPTRGHSVTRQQLCRYLLADYPGAGRTDTLDLLFAVRRALERLEEAGIVSPISIQREPVWQITPLGESVLADGTVRQRLQRP